MDKQYNQNVLDFAWAILEWKPSTKEDYKWFLKTSIGDVKVIDSHCGCCPDTYELNTEIDLDGSELLDNIEKQLTKIGL